MSAIGKAEQRMNMQCRKIMRISPAGNIIRFPALYDASKPIIIAPIDDTLLSGAVNGLENPEHLFRKPDRNSDFLRYC